MTEPFETLGDWLAAARDHPCGEPDAMALSTVDEQGHPSSRMVLLKGLDPDGLLFVTNYESRKSAELAGNPHAALLFFWEPLHRQVRIEGQVARASVAESDRLHSARARGSQIGAWASPQSRSIASRSELERRCSEAAARFPGKVPRPPHWGAFRLVPTLFEFWIGQPNRLHDRFEFRLAEDGTWNRERLAP